MTHHIYQVIVLNLNFIILYFASMQLQLYNNKSKYITFITIDYFNVYIEGSIRNLYVLMSYIYLLRKKQIVITDFVMLFE